MEKLSDLPRFVNLWKSRRDSADEPCRLSFHCHRVILRDEF